jgi:hypothetical protein
MSETAAAIPQCSNALTNVEASVIQRATLYDTESQAADNVCCTASIKFCDWPLTWAAACSEGHWAPQSALRQN